MNEPVLVLAPEAVEAIAQRVAELLRPEPKPAFLTVRQAAARLGVSPAYVYEHADALGAIRLGDGRRPRLRFPAERLDALGRGAVPAEPQVEPDSDREHGRRARRRRPASAGGLLPIRGEALAEQGGTS